MQSKCLFKFDFWAGKSSKNSKFIGFKIKFLLKIKDSTYDAYCIIIKNMELYFGIIF